MIRIYDTTVASRLPNSEAEKLTRFVKNINITKSEFIRDLIIEFLSNKKKRNHKL